MLLFSRNIDAGLRFAAWHISEGEAFFRDDLPLSPTETTEVALHQNPARRMEWFSSRWLLHQLTGQPLRMPLTKNAYSKPFFTHDQNQFCSLSHSQGIVAALLSDRECGCDMQVLVEKMPRIAPKFMRADEFEWVQKHPISIQFYLQHVFWTAKEALYKAYGLKELDFKAHLFIEPFEWTTDEVMRTTGWISKGDIRVNYELLIGFYESQLEHVPSFVWTVASG